MKLDVLRTSFPKDLYRFVHKKFHGTLKILGPARRWAPLWALVGWATCAYQMRQSGRGCHDQQGTTANPLVMSWLRHLFWLSAIHNYRITAVYIPGIQNVRADSISRMHDSSALLQLYSLLLKEHSPEALQSELLVNHMSRTSALFLASRFCLSGLQGAR